MAKLDKQGEEEAAKNFEQQLKRSEEIQEEVKRRAAESGEKPDDVLFGIDHKNHKIAIVPANPPAPDKQP